MKNSQNVNKKNNTAIYVRFALALVLSLVVGFGCGMAMSVIKKLDIKIDKETILGFLNTAVPIAYIVFTVLLIAVSMIIYTNNKKMAKNWDGEDEEVIDRIEARQNIPMILSSILLVGGMLFFSLCVYVNEKVPAQENKYAFLVFALTFMVSLAGAIMIQACVVGLEKNLNPEKRGNVFDFKFLKSWEKSSDEAEKLIQYKGGYKAYICTNFACMVLWLITFISMLVFNTGFFAVACVCFIWLFMSLVYSFAVARLEKKKDTKQ